MQMVRVIKKKKYNRFTFTEMRRQKYKWTVDFLLCNPKSLNFISFLIIVRAGTET